MPPRRFSKVFRDLQNYYQENILRVTANIESMELFIQVAKTNRFCTYAHLKIWKHAGRIPYCTENSCFMESSQGEAVNDI